MPTDILPSTPHAPPRFDARLADIGLPLTPEENVLAYVEVDLDEHLRFSPGCIAVTERRLLARAPGSDAWRSWDYRPGFALRHFDHAGVGTLELCDETARLAAWRYTLGQNVAALQVLDQFERRLESLRSGRPVRLPEENVCPHCKAVLETGQDECPICTRAIHTPPSTWTLLRLWRFAKPYRGQL
ncbi:MAG: hypothetical protein PHY45_09460, partial [Rhodocyclaceae bacterium]|nr:hypothetical protein [Rhodocyclaceae bacterium]